MAAVLTVTISGEAGAGSFIIADSTVNGGGADTITINGAQAGGRHGHLWCHVTIKGKGGADEFDFNGNLGGNSAQLGNAGADLIDSRVRSLVTMPSLAADLAMTPCSSRLAATEVRQPSVVVVC